MDIGFIGLGRMGRPMARRLLEAGHRLVVGDRDPRAVEALLALGAAAGGRPSEIASLVETVLLCLPTPEVVEEVALGPDGLASGARLRTVVDLSTTGPEITRRVAAGLGARGIVLLDAPVSGGVAGAAKGSLAVMAAGPPDALAALRPVLKVLGRVFHVGAEPGLGQAMKLLNNLLSATALAATSEAMVLGAKAGLDPARMIEVLNAGTGRNSATEDKFPRAILTGRFDAGFATALISKDLRLCLDLAAGQGVPLSIGERVAALFQQALAENGPDADFTTVIRPLEDRAGVQVRARAGSDTPE